MIHYKVGFKLQVIMKLNHTLPLMWDMGFLWQYNNPSHLQLIHEISLASNKTELIKK